MIEQIRPKKLFRFFPPEASDFFSSKKLWFSAIADFNDPFEALPSFDSEIRSKIEAELKKEYAFYYPGERIDWPQFKRKFSQQVSQRYEEDIDCIPLMTQQSMSELFGIICFVEDYSSLLMWGHYAKGHTGFVVEFDPNHQLFQTDNQKDVFSKVDYPPHRPKLSGAFPRILLMKSKEWERENEYRLIKPVTMLKIGERKFADGRLTKRWFLDLPTDLVRRVYLGCRMADLKRDEIKESLELPEWKNVETFVTRVHRSDYAVQPIPLKNWKPMSPESKEAFEKAWDAVTKKHLDEAELQHIKKGH